jgi:vanillate O-demethylase ferredoxin subunit
MNSPQLELVVACKADETAEIARFELVAADGAMLPAFTAGAHIDVAVPGGLTRQYSLCNDPAERHRYVIGVLREAEGRGGSRAMHAAVQPGSRLQVSAPKNHFALADDAPHSLLLAGGIGVTPILAMAEQLAAQGRAFALHYCARSAPRLAFQARIAQSRYAAQAHVRLDEGPAAQRLDIAKLLAAQPVGTHLYVCGPQGFMDAVLGAARAAGWSEERLHYEFFAADVAPKAGDGSFDVKIASTGQCVRVAADQTVAQALAAVGVAVMTSCEQGVCGTCITRVLDGQVDHRDMFLTPEEQARHDQFTPCCSRATTACLVLDL